MPWTLHRLAIKFHWIGSINCCLNWVDSSVASYQVECWLHMWEVRERARCQIRTTVSSRVIDAHKKEQTKRKQWVPYDTEPPGQPRAGVTMVPTFIGTTRHFHGHSIALIANAWCFMRARTFLSTTEMPVFIQCTQKNLSTCFKIMETLLEKWDTGIFTSWDLR